ncbi:MAG TPA: two-component regulator propeller domain-containing protein [Candidatus Eremiobacteraceae bacterium]|nr:two-component regulator propeller domain-containing protein [Candidatus Eremiobacteraceae bacterium]
MASGQPLPLRFKCPRTTIAAALGSYLICVLLLAGTVHALDPNKHLTQYIRTSWKIQNGSLPAGMFSITQTSDGFLWFASLSQGLYRFDGVRFLPWVPPAKIGSIHIQEVFADHAGGLWAIGDREIAHVRDGAVIAYFDFEGIGGHAGISRDPDGSLWITRTSNTVSDAPLCHITDRAAKCFGKSDGMPISPADTLLADGEGGFWIGGQTALVHWRAGVSQIYPIEGLKSNAGDVGINSLARGADGSLWVGIAAAGPGLGLGKLSDGVFRPFVTLNFDGSKVSVYDMIFDGDGSLWVASVGKGIFRIRGDVVEHYGRTEGLSSDTVGALFEDREGIIWAATTNGIDSFRDPRIVTFSASEGLGNDAVVGVLASHDGTIWVANSGSLDHVVNGSVSSIRAGNGLPGHQVASMIEDRAGNMWVGVDDALYLFKNGRFRRLPESNHKPLGLVVGMTEDVDGNIWAECASSPRKLVRIRDFKVVEEFTSSQVPPGHTLAPDPHGGIWIGTLKGDVALFRHGVVEKFALNPKGYPVSHQIIADADGSVLAASEDGLVGLRQDKVQRMTKKNGLPCDSVISFIEDDAKHWWLYTGCGVVELPDSELERWWANPVAVVQTHVYDVLDGARPQGGPSFNSAAYSSGRVWFASGFVLQMVDPSRLSQKALPPQTYIESLVADRKEFEATPNLKVPPNPRDLQIDYTSPTFSTPQKVNFRYRLDNYDRDWHDAGTRRQAFYTDLPPGKYSFRVIASNSDGVWNQSAAKLDFSVAPAYYQTNWFRALCACIFLALLWAAYQWRVRQLQHQFDMTIEARVGERTRIARDLHDTLLQSAHGVLLRFQTVSLLLPDRPMEAKEKLDNAIDQTADFITEARDEVQGLRDSTVQSNDLALAISTLGQELGTDSANHRPAFRVAVEGEARNLHPILRDEIYKIAAEALRNAFRHSQARQIEVEIRYDNEQFRLRVRDDGKGVDPAILSSQGSEGHYGLPGMRERATLIGGKLVVWSEVGAGAEVEVRLPAATAYATTRRRSWLVRKFAAKV